MSSSASPRRDRTGPRRPAVRCRDRRWTHCGRQRQRVVLRRSRDHRRPHRPHRIPGRAAQRGREPAGRCAWPGRRPRLHRHPGALARRAAHRRRACGGKSHARRHHRDHGRGLDERADERSRPPGCHERRSVGYGVLGVVPRGARLRRVAACHGTPRDVRERRLVPRRGDRADLRQGHGRRCAHARRARHDARRHAPRHGGWLVRSRERIDLSTRKLRHHRRAGGDRQGDVALRRRVHHAHAVRGRPVPRGDRRSDSDRPRGRRAGRDLPPEGGRPAQLAKGRGCDRQDRLGAKRGSRRAGRHVPLRRGRDGPRSVPPTLGLSGW